ncbi:hypothetical protein WJX81_004608 [Elliptochloris bilobata]|uniref:SET domain-containing protein n=1 Tax=Elliptochloris bilobata TaxID=381761 RepID=A0AAW1S3N0_9CHLO
MLLDDCCIARELARAGLSHRAGPDKEAAGLMLAVLAERHCLSSRWAPYLAWLPKSLPRLPLSWPQDALALLAGTAAADKLDGKWARSGAFVEPPAEVEVLWRDIARPFLEHHRTVAPAGREHAEFLWAAGVVGAYSFTLGRKRFQAMVPLWDALNSVTGRANVRLHHCARSASLQMIATQGIAQGEEVINCYGRLSPGELLRRYGISEPGPSLCRYKGCFGRAQSAPANPGLQLWRHPCFGGTA